MSKYNPKNFEALYNSKNMHKDTFISAKERKVLVDWGELAFIHREKLTTNYVRLMAWYEIGDVTEEEYRDMKEDFRSCIDESNEMLDFFKASSCVNATQLYPITPANLEKYTKRHQLTQDKRNARDYPDAYEMDEHLDKEYEKFVEKADRESQNNDIYYTYDLREYKDRMRKRRQVVEIYGENEVPNLASQTTVKDDDTDSRPLTPPPTPPVLRTEEEKTQHQRILDLSRKITETHKQRMAEKKNKKNKERVANTNEKKVKPRRIIQDE